MDDSDETEMKGEPKVDIPIECFDKICRVCLAPSETLYPIINVVFNHKHNEEEVSLTLDKVFKKYCDVVIKYGKLKPQNVCEGCLDITSKAFSAFELFNASNARLDNIISLTKNKEKHSENVSVDSDASDGNQEHASDTELFDETVDGDDDDIVEIADYDAAGDDHVITSTDDDCEINGTGSGSRNLNKSLDKSTFSKKQNRKFETAKKKILSEIQREAQIFKCNLCDSGVIKGSRLVIEHIKDEHRLEKRCIVCSKKFANFSSVIRHVKEFHSIKNEETFLCKQCNEDFESQVALDEHMETEEHKNHSSQCTCHFCKKKFTRGVMLKKHILEVHFKEYNQKEKCAKCGVVLQYDGNVTNHVCADEKIEKEKSLLCSECGLDFPSQRQLKLHHKKEHITLFECDYCSENFKRADSLFKHRVSHPECTDVVCPICNEVSETYADYKIHRFNKHSDHVCHICGKGFHKQSTLTQHLNTHSAKQVFQCHLCSQKFKYKATLTLHINEHINKPAYACSYCDKTFKRQRLLRMHKTVVHNNVKKFKCNKCDKAFTNNWSLSSHLRSHMGYRPFTCPFCSKAFADTTNRHRHVKKHHSDMMDEFESYKQTYQAEEVRRVNLIPITSINRSSGDEQDADDLEVEEDIEMTIEEEEEIIFIKPDEEFEIEESYLSEGD